MKTMFKYLLVFFASILLYACEEKVVMLYENEPALYFFRGDDYTNNIHQKDSLIYSFYTKETKRQRDTLYLNIRTMGIPLDHSRAIHLVQTNMGGETDAVVGTHYVAFDEAEMIPNMVISAGAVMSNIPVILLRDPSMKLKEFRINLEIVGNENFEIGLEAQKTFLIKISDMTAPPSNWSSWQFYFGEWGPIKMKFIIEYVGLTDFDKYSEFTQAELKFFKMKVNQKLEEYNTKNDTTLMEDDQITIVSFPK